MDAAMIISLGVLAISILALFVSWRVFYRDRAKIRIKLEYLQRTPDYMSFNIDVTNHGRKVAYIDRYSIRFKDGTYLSDNIAGGEPIDEGQVVNFWLPIHDHLGNPTHDPTLIKHLDVYDTLGNRYKYPGCSLKELLEFRHLIKNIRNHLSYGDRQKQ
jgi:hypothetical protein